jgi:hypothetical protein
VADREVPREGIDTAVEILGEPLGALDLREPIGIADRSAVDRIETHSQGGHLLTELVVDVAGDPAALLFLNRDDALQERLGLPLVGAPLHDFSFENLLARLPRALRRVSRARELEMRTNPRS